MEGPILQKQIAGARRRADDDRSHGSRREDRGRDDRRRARNGSLERVAGGEPREGRGRSLPPSPRTTSSDVIEINPSGPGLGWLCGTACLMTKVQPSIALEGHHESSRLATLVQEAPAAPDSPMCQATPLLCQAPALPSTACWYWKSRPCRLLLDRQRLSLPRPFLMEIQLQPSLLLQLVMAGVAPPLKWYL